MASHADKFLTKLLFGFAAISASIFVIVFACFERVKYDDWYGWGLVASALMCTGIFLSLSAFVHKVKADFMRRQKSKELQEKKYSSKD
jgi:ABC-type nickel/cobalt efflux system permease component RcnA